MSYTIEIDNVLLKNATKYAEQATTQELVAIALSEFVERRAEKKLSDLRGKVKFSDDYDYKALRA